jgi:hypothetical protein
LVSAGIASEAGSEINEQQVRSITYTEYRNKELSRLTGEKTKNFQETIKAPSTKVDC